LPLATKNVSYCVATVLTFVHYVHVLKQEVLNLEEGYTLYALKFAKLVRLSAQSTLHIMLLVKPALRLVKNVLPFVKNLQLLKHGFKIRRTIFHCISFIF
jgi:hypothetical protein